MFVNVVAVYGSEVSEYDNVIVITEGQVPSQQESQDQIVMLLRKTAFFLCQVW